MEPYTPTWYQVEDSDAMLEYQYAYLWADPGTGKTLTSMEALRKGKFDRAVIICPKIALAMWKEELEKHLGLTNVAVLRTGKVPKKLALHSFKVVITTYDLAPALADRLKDYALGKRNVNDRTHDKSNAALILDEAHRVKSKDAKRTIAILGRNVLGLDGIVRPFEAVWMLTGTPITRYADDLWAPLVRGRHDILKYHGVETYAKFVNEFCTQEYKSYHPSQPKRLVITGSRNPTRLSKILADCKVIRRKLNDVVDNMPEVTYRTVDVGYTNVENVTVNEATLIKELSNPDSGLSKVRRMLGIAKASDVASYILEEGRKPVLVGFWHKQVAEELRQILESEGLVVAVVDGSTAEGVRLEYEKDFNSGIIDVLLGQVQAMGEVLNLQAMCDHVIIAEELISPSQLQQFVARVHRRGQKRHVQVDFCRSEHSIDDALHRIRTRKRANIDRTIT